MPHTCPKVKAWTRLLLQFAYIKQENSWVIIVNERLPNIRLPDLLHYYTDVKIPFLQKISSSLLQ